MTKLITVILKQQVNGADLGRILKVPCGYARNYLLPKGKAILATEENIKEFEAQKELLIAEEAERIKQAEEVLGKLVGLVVTITSQAGDEGKLYGSVTNKDIIAAIKKVNNNIDIKEESIVIPDKIKNVGVYQIPLHLYHNIRTNIELHVIRQK